MKIWKNRLDEMQEQKMLQIEHNACWLAFWGLLAVMFGQILYYGIERAQVFLGEWIVFMCLAVYLVTASIRNGIWDRTLRPSLKTNFYVSLIGAVVGSLIRVFAAYRMYGDIGRALKVGGIVFGCVLVICFLCMSLGLWIYRKRVARLEAEGDEEQPDEHRKNVKFCRR
ncbi:MAG: hypothetical protein HFH76_09550 [Lachnospiraceae bacterium]|nr:hypothetical protein [Lachnospiraceae bacterium]